MHSTRPASSTATHEDIGKSSAKVATHKIEAEFVSRRKVYDGPPGVHKYSGVPVDVMLSSGGVMNARDAGGHAAALLLSGPAGGAHAAAVVAAASGYPSAISFDVGGTSTDVCLVRDGAPEWSADHVVDGYPCRLPALSIHTVGAGGGSVAWVDDGGALRVGPESAGADPGPVSYGRRGTESRAAWWRRRIR